MLASLEIATTQRDRAKGLLGRDGFDGALLLEPARSVHTFGMRFPIDVAFLDDDLVVVRTVTSCAASGSTMPVRGAHHAMEAEAGAFARWDLASATGSRSRAATTHPDGNGDGPASGA